MKELFVSFVSVALSVSAFALAPTDFKAKLPIAVNPEAVGDKTATDLPVLVRLSEAIDGFKYSDLAADGSDLAFGVEQGGNLVVYPHEIDTWDATGESLVWVKVPTVAKGTTFAMYYGNGASGGAAASATWSNYTGVWHFGEAKTLTTEQATTWPTAQAAYANSTAAEGLEGYLSSDSLSGEEGRFGKCFRTNEAGCKTGNFNNGGVWVNDAGTDSPLDRGDTFTISGWFNHPAEKYYYDHIFYKRSQGDNKTDKASTKKFTGGFAIELSANSQATPKFDVRGGNGTAKQGGAINAYNAWSYLTFVFEGSKITVYENGTQEYSATGLAAVTNNDAPLGIGTRPDIAYSGCTGDACWCGWIDEVRLNPSAASADYIALEYAAMATDDFLSFGTPEEMDETMPVFNWASVERNEANDGFVVSFGVKSGSGWYCATFTDAVSGEVSQFRFGAGETSMNVPSTELPANRVFDCAIAGESTNGNPFSRVIGRIYNGQVSVNWVADALEETLTPGQFAVTTAAALPAAIEFAYALGGTAEPDSTYIAPPGAVAMDGGADSAVVEIKPIYNSDVAEDVTVSLDLTAGTNFLLGDPTAAELTIVNASIDPYARYVSPNGSTEGTGRRDAPFATIAQALATMDADGGTIWLDDGVYPVTETILLAAPVTIRSQSGDPTKVTVKKQSGNIGVFKLNHAEARILDITVADGGNNNVDGGNVYIDVNGGIVEHCILENGNVSATYNKAGGNVYMKAGVVTRSIIRGGIANYAAGGGGVWMSGGQVESCLIEGNVAGAENAATYAGDVGGGVHLTGVDAKLVNCTLVKNRGNKSPAVQVDYDSETKAPKGMVINCVIVDNLTMNGTWDFANVGGAAESAAAFVNCMTDARIAQPNETCFAGPLGFADRPNGDYRLLGACVAVDAGVAVTLYSDLDLDGNPRTSGSAIDAGCYEFQQAAESVGAAVSDDEILVGEEATFTAMGFGGVADDVVWDFGEGEEGATGAEVTHAFVSEGWKNVTATIGETSCTVKVKVCPEIIEIAKGDDFLEKASWATDGTTILVGAGTYVLESHFIITKAIVLEGVGEKPSDVVLSAPSRLRVIYMSHPDAVIRNLQMQNGTAYQSNGGNCYICDWGGTVSNCVFAGGTADNHNGNGGNLYQMAGLVTHCVLTNSLVNNTGGGSKGGNVVITGGRLENSLIANGRDTTNGGNAGLTAGLRIAGGKVLNCTIAGNASKTCGGVSSSGAGTIENCVIAGNDGAEPVCVDPPKSGDADYGVFVHCAIDTVEPVNETCVAASAGALMADVANGDFHAAPGAKSIDFPEASDEGAPAVDLDGNARIQGKGIDLGCYEYEAGTLAVSFDSDIKQAIYPVEVTFTATVDGADDGDVLSYGWDYDGDGIVDETTDTPEVKHTWTTGGTFTIGLYVSDKTSGQDAQAIKPDMEKFAPAVMYVDLAGTDPVVPFADWETASTNLSLAIDAAVDGCEIVVAKGLYANGKRPLVEKNIHIRGVTGDPEDVVFRCVNHGSLFVNNEGAFVDSITFTNGFSAAGTDAGIEFGINGGTVSNCVVHTTEARNWVGSGSAVYCPYAGGFVTHCRFYDCKLQGACGGGSKPIVYLPKGRVENSLFTGCSDTFNADDDHIQMLYVGSEGSVVNCTFVGNTAGDCHFMEIAQGGVVANCAFASNVFPAKVEGDPWTGFCQEGIDLDAAFVNCAFDAGFADAPNATCRLGTVDTFFKDFANGNLVPRTGGDLFNRGTTPAGWKGITDLAGNPRVAGKIDIGCYEGPGYGMMIMVK